MGTLSIVALVGCGDSDSSSSGSTTSGAESGRSSSADDARVRLAQCLREHGVDVPDSVAQGGAPPANIDRERVRTLLEGDCADDAKGAFGDASGGSMAEFRDAFAVYAQCMRERGIDLPDLPASGGVPSAPDVDMNDPAFKRAQEACADKLPNGIPGGGQ